MLEIQPGDILITCAGPRARCGVACLVKAVRRRLMISGKMYRFRVPEESVDPRFVEFFLQTAHAQAQIDTMKTGGSDSGLNLTHDRFRQLVVPLAPHNEQVRIVAEVEKQFTRLDAAIAALKRVQANLKRYRASILKAACEGRLVPSEAELARREGRSYEPASALLERILVERRAGWPSKEVSKSKYSDPLKPDVNELRDAPEGWCQVTLDCLLREPLRNGHSAKAVGGTKGVPTFTLSAVTYGDFSAENIKMTSADPVRVRDLWVEPQDIFIERSNTPELVGTTRLYSGPPRVAIFPDLLIRARLVSGAIPTYIELVLQSSPVRRFFRRKAQGISGTMPKIDQSVVQQTIVPLPPIAEQKRIVDFVQDQFSVIQYLETEIGTNLRKADSLRQSVLKNAFEGKLIPQDPNEEPTSVLLERIRGTATHGSVPLPGRRTKRNGRALASKETANA